MLLSENAIWVILFFIVGLSFFLEKYTKIGKSIGATLLCILMGMTLSNLDLVPIQSNVYDNVFSTLTYLAIVFLLLSVNLSSILSVGPKLLIIFLVSCICTCIGSIIAFFCFNSLLGDLSWKLSGVLTGTYTGGSLNFVGVAHALNFPSSHFSAAAAADNIVTAIWIGLCLILPKLIGKFYPAFTIKNNLLKTNPKTDKFSLTQPISIIDLCFLSTLGYLVLEVSAIIHNLTPTIPKVIWITTLSLILAQIKYIQSLKGGFLFGMIGLHLFFVVIGIGSRFSSILQSGGIIFIFTAIVVLIHAIILLLSARLFKWDINSTLVASQAAIGGPSTAMGLAITKKWNHLAVPGLLIGLAGYAVGNYLGIFVAKILKLFF